MTEETPTPSSDPGRSAGRLATALLGAASLGAAGAAFAARRRRARDIRRLVDELIEGAAPPSAPEEPTPVPPVVAIWLSRATEGLPGLPRAVRLRQKGRMEVRPGGGWRPFQARHWMAADPPGFVWDARFAGPGRLFDLFRVRDSYLSGRGGLRADLLGMVGVVDVGTVPGDRPEISVDEERLSRAELLRWLAELPWFPVAALPGGSVRWEEIDDRTARAVVADAGHRVEAVYRFGPHDFPERVDVDARWRNVDGRWQELPWRGRFRDVGDRGGLLIPREGEVAWVEGDAEIPYWRGTIRAVEPIW